MTHSKTHARKWTEIFPVPEKRTESKSQSDPFQTVKNLVAEKTKSYEFSSAQKNYLSKHVGSSLESHSLRQPIFPLSSIFFSFFFLNVNLIHSQEIDSVFANICM